MGISRNVRIRAPRSRTLLTLVLAAGILCVPPPWTPAHADKYGAPHRDEEQRNEGTQDKVLRTSSILKMKADALAKLLWEVRVRTTDGFGHILTLRLVQVVRFDRSNIRRFLERMSRLRGVKFRRKLLAQEARKQRARLTALQARAKKLLDDPAKRGEVDRVLRQINGMQHLVWFLEAWAKNPSVGPGGSVRVDP